MIAAIGFFDGVHLGHQFLLRQVKAEALQRGLRPAVVTFNQHPLQVVHPGTEPPLLTTPEEKFELLKAYGIEEIVMMDFTHELSLLPARTFMKRLHDNYGIRGLVIGYDHRFGHNREEGFEQYAEYGRELGIDVIQATAYREADKTVSSSAIRTLIAEGQLEEANRLLGHPYTLRGIVVEGRHMGRKLGFPTANIRPDTPHKMIAKNGVYAVKVQIDEEEKMRYGMMSIGTRPTLHNGTDQSIEIHLFNFSDMIYGRRLKVDVTRRTRDEQRFASLDDLKARLGQDKEEISRHFEQRLP